MCSVFPSKQWAIWKSCTSDDISTRERESPSFVRQDLNSKFGEFTDCHWKVFFLKSNIRMTCFYSFMFLYRGIHKALEQIFVEVNCPELGIPRGMSALILFQCAACGGNPHSNKILQDGREEHNASLWSEDFFFLGAFHYISLMSDFFLTLLSSSLTKTQGNTGRKLFRWDLSQF